MHYRFSISNRTAFRSGLLYLMLLPVFAFFYLSANARQMTYKDLRGSWDTVSVLSNPHKGWYIHYYDNSLQKYGPSLQPDDLLTDFKGLYHVYLRLAWSYLEPRESEYNWPLIDSIIDKWTAKGYKITFRISCKETEADQVFATPEWVKDAGAKGAFVGRNKNWEPDFGDSIFLSKLENFHRVFGQRYGNKPWLAYVDIGSIGDWGEGHTVFGSQKEYPFTVIRQHIDLFKRCYPTNLLMISDDIITSRRQPGDPESAKILDYILAQGIAFRDDSVSVKYFADNYGFSTLRSQFLFEKTWRSRPTDLELEHYPITVRDGTWKEGKPLEAAIAEARASYVGFHGPPRQWLNENRDYVDRVTNKIGYWYFIQGVRYPDQVKAGERIQIAVSWLNKGVAPAYHQYKLSVGISCGGKFLSIPVSSDNRKWMPDSLVTELYEISLPNDMPNGSALIGLKLEDTSGSNSTPVALGMKWKNPGDYYNIGKINVLARGKTGKKKLILFGDSITQDAFGDKGYASLLSADPVINQRYEIIGQGVGGNRITDLHKRLEKDVFIYQPATVLVFVGVNDCGWHDWHPKDSQVTVARYERDLENLVQKIKRKGASVIICTPAVIGEQRENRSPSDLRLDQYADACRRVAKRNRCPLVDIRKTFVDYLQQNNPANKPSGILTHDTVHPSEKGSGLIAAAIRQTL